MQYDFLGRSINSFRISNLNSDNYSFDQVGGAINDNHKYVYKFLASLNYGNVKMANLDLTNVFTSIQNRLDQFKAHVTTNITVQNRLTITASHSPNYSLLQTLVIVGHGNKIITQINSAEVAWDIFNKIIHYNSSYPSASTINQIINPVPVPVSPVKIGDHEVRTALQYCYNNYLSKPYTGTPDPLNTPYGSIPRHNHALAHVMRKVEYLNHVVPLYLNHNSSKMSSTSKNYIRESMPLIKIALIFFISGRIDESSSGSNLANYKQGKVNSAQNLVNYTSALNLSTSDKQKVEAFRRIILSDKNPGGSPEFNHSSHPSDLDRLQHLITICHNLDMARVVGTGTYNSITGQFVGVGALSHQDASKLKNLVYLCLLKTGNGILAGPYHQNYSMKIFYESSININKCQQNIDEAVDIWKSAS